MGKLFKVTLYDIPSSVEVEVEIPGGYEGDKEEIKILAFREALEQGMFDEREFDVEYEEVSE